MLSLEHSLYTCRERQGGRKKSINQSIDTKSDRDTSIKNKARMNRRVELFK